LHGIALVARGANRGVNLHSDAVVTAGATYLPPALDSNFNLFVPGTDNISTEISTGTHSSPSYITIKFSVFTFAKISGFRCEEMFFRFHDMFMGIVKKRLHVAQIYNNVTET